MTKPKTTPRHVIERKMSSLPGMLLCSLMALTACGTGAGSPDADTPPPGADASGPGEDADAPGDDAGAPDDDAGTPGDDAGEPDDETAGAIARVPRPARPCSTE